MERDNSIDSHDKQQLAIVANIVANDISNLIAEAKYRISREYNVTQVRLYWLIGRRINEEILKLRRAHYGEQIIDNIADFLTQRYGRGYSRPNLFRMLRFSKLFDDL